MKRLVINKFNGGISNDPSFLGLGFLNYAEGVDVRKDSKQITLSYGTPDYKYLGPLTTLVTGYIVATLDNYLRTHLDGNITSSEESNIFGSDVTGDVVINLGEALYNIGNITTPVANYGYVFGATKLYKWVYNSATANLGIYDTTSLVTTGSFSSATGWTVGANWSISGGLATHTTGSIAGLSQTLTTVTSQVYRIKVVCGTITADSCQIQMGGANQYTFTSADSGLTKVLLYTATGTSTLLEFIPATGFDGAFDSIEVYKYNIVEEAQTFNAKSPYIIINNFIYVGNGNTITEIDTTSASWIYTTVLTIDLDYTIKGLTKIGDQVFVYASNGSSSRQYLWDGVNTTTTRTITWVDKNIVNVANFANQDYVTTKSAYSNKSGLYLVNGYNLDKKFENTQNDDTTMERIYFDAEYTNAIETIGNKLVIPGIDGLYTYGQQSPGQHHSLIKEYLHQTGQTTALYYSEISEFFLKIGNIGTFNGIEGAWEITINFFNLSYGNNPYYSGFIVLPILYGDLFSNIKNFEKITTGFQLDTGCQIVIYTNNINDTTNYANIAYNYTTLPIVGDTYTFNTNTFTITNITDLGDYCILHTTYTGSGTQLTKGTFTRTAGTGDASFISNKVRYGYKYIGVYSDTSKFRDTINEADAYHQKEIAFELLNTNIAYNTNTPHVYDINLYYNEESDD